MSDMHDDRLVPAAPRQDGARNDEPPDADLVAACLAGEVAAWDALIRRYQSFIYGLALRMGLSSPDAEDVFQDVSLKLYQHLDELRDAWRLSGWLAAVVRQEVWRRWRRKSAVPLSDLPGGGWSLLEAESGPSTPSPEEEVLALERQHLVRECFDALPRECRRLLGLLYGPESPSYAETARRLAMPVGSIGPRRARCLERLKKKLEEFGF
jgi:RNA polymerase sigma factor (sigma-70 family)